MRVTVRLFARLKDIAGAPELERDVPARCDAGRRVGAARARLPRHGPVPRIRVGRAQRRVRAHGRRDRRRRRDRVSAPGVGGIELSRKHLNAGLKPRRHDTAEPEDPKP